MGGIKNLFESFWSKPFNTDGDVLNWILFLGLVVVALAMWKRVVDKIV